MAESDDLRRGASAALILKGAARAQAGRERIALLEAIAETGSITAAALRVGLSFRGGWDAVQALNNLFDAPLVRAAPGGRGGGRAEVTAEGRAVLVAYRAIERDLEAAIAALERRISGAGAASAFDLFWRLGMRTSARNAFRGEVVEVEAGAVNTEVRISLGDGPGLTAIVTRRSAEDLGLRAGVGVIALIKSSSVILAPGAEPPRTSARNALPGVVSRVERGAVNDEVSLDIGGGRTLVATLTHESARDLALAPGAPAVALFKASQIILAVE